MIFAMLVRLFDENEPNIFKRALSPENRVAVFALFEEAVEYIENLRVFVSEGSNEKIPIINSKSPVFVDL